MPWVTDLSDHATAAPWTGGWTERTEQIVWVPDYERDLDADFLALYGIDLEEDTISAKRYFALAHRLPAYQGVMAARVENEREQDDQQPYRPSTTPAQAPSTGQPREVHLTAFRAEFPGFVSMTSAAPEEA